METRFVSVYSDTIKPHRQRHNLSRIEVDRDFLDGYVLGYCHEFHSLAEFLHNHTADDTMNLFRLAKESNAIGTINWQYDEFFDGEDELMTFDVRDLDKICSVPEEELPKWLRDFIRWNYSSMGFMDSYDDEGRYTDENFELYPEYASDVVNLLDRYPCLKYALTFEYGLTSYINTAGYIDWNENK